MNPIKAAYCRAYQTVLRAAMPIMPYRTPKILNSVLEIPGVLKKKKIDNVLLVTDGFLHNSGKLDTMKNALSENGISYSIYDEVVPNPTVWNVEIARERYLSDGCQALIGFGGGSSIDCAKAVGARIACPKKSVYKMKGILGVTKPIPYLIAVPTTAGTGSETSIAAVITDDKTFHKYPISDFPLIPQVAVWDPEMICSSPQNLTSSTGMDALTHAIEAYIGRSTTGQTRAEALNAIRLIADNLEISYENGDDLTARSNMLQAAYLAGNAFSKSYVGYCHAMAHSISGKYQMPHGLANAVLLPYVLESYGESIYKPAKDIAIAMRLADKDTPADEATAKLITHIREMNVRMGIADKIPEIQKEDIHQMAKRAEQEANPLYPVPKLMTMEELEKFYYSVMENPA